MQHIRRVYCIHAGNVNTQRIIDHLQAQNKMALRGRRKVHQCANALYGFAVKTAVIKNQFPWPIAMQQGGNNEGKRIAIKAFAAHKLPGDPLVYGHMGIFTCHTFQELRVKVWCILKQKGLGVLRMQAPCLQGNVEQRWNGATR